MQHNCMDMAKDEEEQEAYVDSCTKGCDAGADKPLTPAAHLPGGEEHNLLKMLNIQESDTETINQLKKNASKCKEPWIDYLRWLASMVREQEAEGILVNTPL